MADAKKPDGQATGAEVTPPEPAPASDGASDAAAQSDDDTPAPPPGFTAQAMNEGQIRAAGLAIDVPYETGDGSERLTYRAGIADKPYDGALPGDSDQQAAAPPKAGEQQQAPPPTPPPVTPPPEPAK